MPTNDYSLLDFGDGRRLERFGPVVVERLCPAAENVPKGDPALWKKADFRFLPDDRFKNSERGRWIPDAPPPWTVRLGPIRLELRGTPFGHVGIFPEQRENWQRIADLLRERAETLRVLNLFAYTGGSSMAAALVGKNVEVVHVDSSKTAVEWARCNAAQNGIAAGIRFIVEDVRKFVRRERKRGNRYDAVILDPPSYGHGVKGQAWKISDHLPPLLDDLAAVLSESPVFMLLTAHSPGFDADRLHDLLAESLPRMDFTATGFSMEIRSETDRILPAGFGVLYTFR